jgi:signal transduction histidine kinase/ActR/RegA family two-component response regulator
MDLSVAGRSFVATIEPIARSDGADRRFVVVLSDVTAARRLAQEERHRADESADGNQRNDRFLAMLAHELRNPLNAISTANALTDRLGPAHERTARLQETIARQTGHLARLVDDLLEVSRFTRGRITLRRERIDIADVLAQTVAASQPLADSRRQTIHLAADRSLYIDGDPLRLEQVFSNVIHNALKYSEPGTEVHVVARRVDGKVVVRIRDQGIGIPASQLAQVFDLFTQVDDSLARSVGGLGIGLTLARTLVELHGGTIEANSEGLGRGAEFVMQFPAATLETARAARPAAPMPHARPLSLVVIEDNEDAAELLGSLLKTLHHRVHVTHDGLSGLTTALSVCPDATLVDIGLPGIDGYQVAENLRGAPATRHTYLVAITGYGRPEDRARALAAGFDRYIVKPITLAALEDALSAAADSAARHAHERRERPRPH